MSNFTCNLLRYSARVPRYLFGLLVVVWGIGGGSYAAYADQNGNDTAYIEYGCYQCHGYWGQGGLLSGPKIAPLAFPYEAFSEIVRHPYGVMPAYAPDVLDETKLKDIYHYLQSIGSEAK